MKARPQMNTIVATLPITIPAMAPFDKELLLVGGPAAIVFEDAVGVVTVVEVGITLLTIPVSDDVLPVVVVSNTLLVYPEIVAQPKPIDPLG
jgi:hypothetical protein